tara:strand:+ start:1251 stop:1520 length:270 start_codon:yes stop_codon:yes gene_type:complete
MTEYKEIVQQQANLLAAEEWAKGISGIHVHQMSSMWYDDRPEDTEDGSVTDTSYNSGVIKRSKDGNVIHIFGEELTGKALVDKWQKYQA